ncbi:MAG: LCP family protein [Streptosporangiales bacterium]
MRRGGGSVDFRRTLVVTLASLVVPGSGHLALRRGRIGHPVLRVYLGLVAVALACIFLVPHGWWVAAAFKPWLLSTVQVLAVVIGMLWAAVVLHAFSISRPLQIRPPRRWIALGVALALSAGILMPFGVAANYAGVQRDLVSSMFPAGGDGPQGRMNILLLGSDAGPDRTGTRTDTMIVVSIDLATGRSVMLSLPRNLQHVPMPEGPARERFPNGFTDLLNAVYGYGVDHPKLEPGSKQPGADLLKDTIGGVLGIPVHYYLQVNLKGFQRMVNALGGVTVKVKQRLPIGGKGGVPITGYVQPGVRKLNGNQALWFARSRVTTDDYDRMSRQRCLLGAIAKQASPVNVLARYQQLAAASKHMFRTDIPRGVMSSLVDVAKKARSHRIDTLSFVPPLIDTADPDWQLIKDETRKAIEAPTRKHGSKGAHKRAAGGGRESTKRGSGAQSIAAACR